MTSDSMMEAEVHHGIDNISLVARLRANVHLSSAGTFLVGFVQKCTDPENSVKDRKMRQKTGENASTTGTYAFDGYVDGTSTPAPTAEEKKIPMARGETLPPVKSSGKAAYWLI